jgi:hypothetical protein
LQRSLINAIDTRYSFPRVLAGALECCRLGHSPDSGAGARVGSLLLSGPAADIAQIEFSGKFGGRPFASC